MNTYPNFFRLLILAAPLFCGGTVHANHLHVTFEPRRIYQLSSKTENARATCQMCQGTIFYERPWNATTTTALGPKQRKNTRRT